MRKLILTSLALLLLTGAVDARPKKVKDWCNSLKGQEYWLKIGVVEVNFGLRGTDATNVYENGNVSYRATINVRQTQASNAEDFAEEARLQLANGGSVFSSVRMLDAGTKVRIKKAKVEKKQIKIELDKQSGAKHALRLKFDDDDYTMEDLHRLFGIAFAENESELMGAEKSVTIDVGMTVEEVIAIRGKPNSRINLGQKTVLTYDDLKLIFQDGKLADVQ